MDLSKLHITTLYSMAVSIVPVLFYLDGYVAHAEDVERTNAQIMLEVQQISLDSKQMNNLIQYRLSENDDEKFILNQQKVMLMQQQNKLIELRREIK